MISRGSFNFLVLDTHSQEQVSAYEQSLYKAFFVRDTIDPDLDFDRKRHAARTKIPYDSQDIFAVKLRDKVVAGMAINYNMAGMLQLELEGFLVDKKEVGACEVLHLFTHKELVEGKSLLETLANFAFEKLISSGKKTIYATCLEKRLRPYLSFGFSLIDQNDIPANGGKTFLLKLTFTKGFFDGKKMI